MITKIGLAMAFSLFSFSSCLIADEITVPVGSQSEVLAEKPSLGQSMQQVESQFGEAIEKTNPVGEPPITRWRYAIFTVYFEHDKVIHSVAHRTKN